MPISDRPAEAILNQIYRGKITWLEKRKAKFGLIFHAVSMGKSGNQKMMLNGSPLQAIHSKQNANASILNAQHAGQKD